MLILGRNPYYPIPSSRVIRVAPKFHTLSSTTVLVTARRDSMLLPPGNIQSIDQFPVYLYKCTCSEVSTEQPKGSLSSIRGCGYYTANQNTF